MSPSTFSLGAAGWLCSACSAQTFQLTHIKVNGKDIQIFRYLDRVRNTSETESFVLFGSISPAGSLFGIPLSLIPPQPQVSNQVLHLPTHLRLYELPTALRPFCGPQPPPTALPLQACEGSQYLPPREVPTCLIHNSITPDLTSTPAPGTHDSGLSLRPHPLGADTRARIPVGPPSAPPLHGSPFGVPLPPRIAPPPRHPPSEPPPPPPPSPHAFSPMFYQPPAPPLDGAIPGTPTSGSPPPAYAAISPATHRRTPPLAPIRLRRLMAPQPYSLRSPPRSAFVRVEPTSPPMDLHTNRSDDDSRLVIDQ